MSNNEFYTMKTDIESELQHYWDCFRGKTIYCNCDDPDESEFYRYFECRFEDLQLERLISTCYKSNNPTLFSNHQSKNGFMKELWGGAKGENY